MQNKITVIVPAYNVEDYIERCLDSISCQTWKNLEIIVIDDGSSDSTGDIIDLCAAKDPRIIAVHQKNAGLVAVRETGISLSTGDYVGFVDGDDAVDPDMYERLIRNALTHNADISHCGLCVHYEDGRREAYHGSGKKVVQDSAESLRELICGANMAPSLCNKLYRRELLLDSCLNASIQSNEDLLRNFVLFSRAKTVVYEQFCGYQYWSRENSMSNDSKLILRTRQMLRARKLILDNSTEPLRPYAMRLWLSTYVDFLNQNYQSKEPKVREFYAHCRQILKQERKNIPFLIRRQQLAAYLLLYAPRLHHIVYHFYESRR